MWPVSELLGCTARPWADLPLPPAHINSRKPDAPSENPKTGRSPLELPPKKLVQDPKNTPPWERQKSIFRCGCVPGTVLRYITGSWSRFNHTGGCNLNQSPKLSDVAKSQGQRSLAAQVVYIIYGHRPLMIGASELKGSQCPDDSWQTRWKTPGLSHARPTFPLSFRANQSTIYWIENIQPQPVAAETAIFPSFHISLVLLAKFRLEPSFCCTFRNMPSNPSFQQKKRTAKKHHPKRFRTFCRKKEFSEPSCFSQTCTP